MGPPGSQTWLRSRLLWSLESLLDLAYSLRQKISFFRKLLGDFLFGNFWYVVMVWRRGHSEANKGVVSQAFHSGLRILRKTKPTSIPYTSWADQLRVNSFLHLPQSHRVIGTQPLVSAFSLLVAIGTLSVEGTMLHPGGMGTTPKDRHLCPQHDIPVGGNTQPQQTQGLPSCWAVGGRPPHRAGGFG